MGCSLEAFRRSSQCFSDSLGELQEEFSLKFGGLLWSQALRGALRVFTVV
jgi:hypothetical protein